MDPTEEFLLVTINDQDCYRMYMVGCSAEAIWRKYSDRYIGLKEDQIDFDKANAELKARRSRILMEKEPG